MLRLQTPCDRHSSTLAWLSSLPSIPSNGAQIVSRVYKAFSYPKPWNLGGTQGRAQGRRVQGPPKLHCQPPSQEAVLAQQSKACMSLSLFCDQIIDKEQFKEGRVSLAPSVRADTIHHGEEAMTGGA